MQKAANGCFPPSPSLSLYSWVKILKRLVDNTNLDPLAKDFEMQILLAGNNNKMQDQGFGVSQGVKTSYFNSIAGGGPESLFLHCSQMRSCLYLMRT